MDIHRLTLFVALANELHFGRTAASHHVSPSTLSRNIKQLEEDLGATLFERDNRSVELTAEGQNFLSFAREVIQQWETYQESKLENADELIGQLSIYCSVTASYSFLYDILTAFRVNHPKIAIKLHTGDPAPAISRILNGDEDIAIAAKPNKLPEGMSFKRISHSPLTFLQSATHAPNLTQIKDWNKIPLIIPEEGIARDRLDEWFNNQKITPNIYAEVRGNEAIVSMVSLGFGVGVVPQIVLDNSPLKTQVTVLKNQPNLGPFDTGICVMNKRLRSPIVRAFWGQLPIQDTHIGGEL